MAGDNTHMNKKNIIFLVSLSIIAFALWSLPAKTSPYPYGEGDAAHQYGEADWRAIEDTAQREYPGFLARWYGALKKDYYAPGNAAPFAINSAIIQTLSGERFLPKTLFLVFIGVMPLIFAIYLLIRKLYDPETAFVSAFFMIFSVRDILAHLMGQRLIIFSLAYVPAVLYCYYKYTKSYLNQKEKKMYLFLSAILAATGALFHPQMLGIILTTVFFYTLWLIFKYRKIPFSIKWALITLILSLIILLPFISDWLAFQELTEPGKTHIQEVGTLFKWFPHPTSLIHSFDMVGGWWLIILVVIGIILLLTNHQDRDILMLCWLTGLYCMLHLNIFGLYEQRLDRFLKGTAHVIYPICVIGFYHISNLFWGNEKNKIYFKYCLYGLLIIFMVFTQGVQAYNHLSTAYQPIMRMTDEQYEMSQWINNNLPEDAIIYTIGTMTYPKQRWMHMLSHRSFEVNHPQEGDGIIYENATHVLVDFSDLIKLNYKEGVTNLQYWVAYQNINMSENFTEVHYNDGLYLYER